MYEPFQFDQLLKPVLFQENFNLSIDRVPPIMQVFTEAYFVDGKKKVEPIITAFGNLKDLLEKTIASDKGKFDSENFIKTLQFKELEDAVREAFGFRNIEIICMKERYDSKKKTFSSEILNCFTYPTWRFPIKGLVTDKGFYDESHSINTTIIFTLGLLQKLSAAECTAILLHEIGHNLDPALVDIEYTTTNVFSKYLTDREGAISKKEKEIVKTQKLGCMGSLLIIGIYAVAVIIAKIYELIKGMTFDKDKFMVKLKKMIKDDDYFSRVTNQEAFADNIARMYGLGAPLAAAFNKIDKNYQKRFSRIKKEKMRQRAIANIVEATVKDVHKTDIHRIYAMIREYEADLKDPAIPEKVKKDIRDDLTEIKKVLDNYLNHRSDFQNRVNQVILEELKAIDADIEKKEAKDSGKTDDEIKKVDKKLKAVIESFEFEDVLDSIVFEAGGRGRSFKQSKNFLPSLEFRVDRLRKLNPAAADKLLKTHGNKLSLVKSKSKSEPKSESKTGYDVSKYWSWDNNSMSDDVTQTYIDITKIYRENAEANGKCVAIRPAKDHGNSWELDDLVTKSNCLGTGMKLKDDNYVCFMQIMTDDLPDPNVFGKGIKVAQLLTVDGDEYEWVTSKKIPDKIEAYEKYHDEWFSADHYKAFELEFVPSISYMLFWDLANAIVYPDDQLKIDKDVKIPDHFTSTDGKQISTADIQNSNGKGYTLLCEKAIYSQCVEAASIGSFTRKTQGTDERCLLNITAELTDGYGESIGDYGTVWVDLKGNSDWDCY